MASTPGNVHLSITRTNAKIYIARPLGGANNPEILAMAEEALLRGYNDWQVEKDWEFLLKDNTSTFTVESCTLDTTATVVVPSAAAFDGVNIGIIVTGSAGSYSSTVAGYSRNTDGTIASITLTDIPTAPQRGIGTITLTFNANGNLPILTGVSDYNLPTDFHKHYGMRLMTTAKRPLQFIRPRDWNRMVNDHTTRGVIDCYTIFNSGSPLSQDKGTYRLRFYRTPANNDTCYFQYYRKFAPLSDPLDMDGQYLYKFLDYCRALIINTKRSFDDPATFLSDTMNSLQKAKSSDEEVTEDEEIRMKSQMEMYVTRPALWNNGDFNRDFGS